MKIDKKSLKTIIWKKFDKNWSKMKKIYQKSRWNVKKLTKIEKTCWKLSENLTNVCRVFLYFWSIFCTFYPFLTDFDQFFNLFYRFSSFLLIFCHIIAQYSMIFEFFFLHIIGPFSLLFLQFFNNFWSMFCILTCFWQFFT